MPGKAKRAGSEPPDGYWPCACVKRGAGGVLTHIKLNSPKLKSCRKCGAGPDGQVGPTPRARQHLRDVAEARKAGKL